MVKILVENLARLYAGKIASYLAVGITFAVIKAVGWLAAHYPPVGSLCDAQAIATWASLAAAAVINDAANRISARDALAAKALEATAQDLKAAPLPVLRAADAHNENRPL